MTTRVNSIFVQNSEDSEQSAKYTEVVANSVHFERPGA